MRSCVHLLQEDEYDKNITLGQYYPTNSVIHRLDPRTKLIGTIAFIVSLFLFKSWLGYAAATLFLAGIIPHRRCPSVT